MNKIGKVIPLKKRSKSKCPQASLERQRKFKRLEQQPQSGLWWGAKGLEALDLRLCCRKCQPDPGFRATPPVVVWYT